MFIVDWTGVLYQCGMVTHKRVIYSNYLFGIIMVNQYYTVVVCSFVMNIQLIPRFNVENWISLFVIWTNN